MVPNLDPTSGSPGAATAQLTNAEFERRVTARQLVLMSAPTRGMIIGTPLWAVAVVWITSGAFPALGKAALLPALCWLAAIVATCLAAFIVDKVYNRALANPSTFDPTRWVWRYTMTLAVMSCTWASLIWVFWIDTNEVNQLSLTILVFCGVTNGIISRMNKFEAFLVGSGLAIFILWSRFLTASSDAAAIFTLLLPLWFLAMSLNVRTASAQVRKNIATQIENELLNAAIAKARDEAERANQMKSTFLANMSHELRTPLNAILGFSEIIATQGLGAAAQDRYSDYARDINASGTHLLNLINDLLDIAKIEAGKLKLTIEQLDANAILAQALKLIEDRAREKGLELHLNCDPAVKLLADERGFKQIAINLLSNAVKFTDSGSISVQLENASDGAKLIVEDTGRGVPRDHIDQIFRSFEQIDNQYARANGGTGLGLTLVRALAELHGGTCRLESEVGKGTRVEVLFPSQSVEEEPPDAISHAA